MDEQTRTDRAATRIAADQAGAALIGAHVEPDDPLAAALERGADVVQFFLADPQAWTSPQPRPDADQLRTSAVAVFIHAPYRINLASPNNRIRIPSRKLLVEYLHAAAQIGARGLIVHGGHVGAGAELDGGFDAWRKALAYAADQEALRIPLLIENTAGGDNACARKFDTLARLWDAVGGYNVGFCLDTCHAFAAGEQLATAVARVRSVTGRIDLIHANGSKGDFDSGQDRHDNLTSGTIDPGLIVGVVRTAGAPVVVETPGGSAGQAADIRYLRQAIATR